MTTTLPPNLFKRRLRDVDGGVQWGLFVSLADPVAAEIAAGAGFDLVVIDAEHGPNDVRTILGQLHAIAGYGAEAAVRVPDDDATYIKRILDLGARTLIVPMVDTAEQAVAAVNATRYPPDGIRGVSSARAARWGRVADYHAGAANDICVILQVESATGLAHIDEISAVEGVDAVFIGPMDLASSLGHLADGTHPDVVAIVADALGRVSRAGATPAVMATRSDLVSAYCDAGARFVAVGVDTAMLAAATSALRDGLADR